MNQTFDKNSSSVDATIAQFDELHAKVKDIAAGVVDQSGDRSALTLLHHHLHNLALYLNKQGKEAVVRSVKAMEDEVMALIQQGAPAEPERLNVICERIEQFSFTSDDDAVKSTSIAAEVYNPRLIYIVDNDADRNRHLTEQLRLYGYQSQGYSSLNAMEDAFAKTHPDAMIISLETPEGDLGCMLMVEKAKQRLKFSCPVIFVATKDDLTVRLGAVNIGARGFFRRPVQIDQLVDRLDFLTARPDEEPYRVLVVDDEPIMAQMHSAILKSAGMQVDSTTSPEDFLEAVEKCKPELVLMDMHMPWLSGADLTSIMRQHELYDGIPVIFLSAETDEKYQIEAIHQGGDDFLTKPVQPSHLISVVLHHARRYRAESDGVNRDGVTGLLNYGSLSHALRALMKGQDALTLALLDVTQFAEINRRFGEKAGDQVLRRIAHQLRLHLGQQTLLARMSGDTFAVVFPGLNGDIARSRIETVQRSISGIRHEIDQQAFNINCRAGLACSPPATDLEQLLYAAEQALQQARTVGPAAIGGCS